MNSREYYKKYSLSEEIDISISCPKCNNQQIFKYNPNFYSEERPEWNTHYLLHCKSCKQHFFALKNSERRVEIDDEQAKKILNIDYVMPYKYHSDYSVSISFVNKSNAPIAEIIFAVIPINYYYEIPNIDSFSLKCRGRFPDPIQPNISTTLNFEQIVKFYFEESYQPFKQYMYFVLDYVEINYSDGSSAVIGMEASQRIRKDIDSKFPNVLKAYYSLPKEGCYIATAVYGAYDSPEVKILRRFRDTVLNSTWYGKLFVNIYYLLSPIAVKLFGKANWFNLFFKKILDEIIVKLMRTWMDSDN